MAFPNVSDLIATTLEQRSGKIADNVTDNNALLRRLSEKGKVRPFSGGRLIYEEISFADNGNAGYYSGYDTLSVAAQDVISAAEFTIKQAACPVVVSGLEQLQNAGKEAVIDLLEARIAVAESSIKNLIANGLYSDGTGSGGKQITGLGLAVPTNASTGTYGGIDRTQAANAFWRPITSTGDGGTESATTIQTSMNGVWSQLVRGTDSPDLIVTAQTPWNFYMGSLQLLQRFTSSKMADLGFPSVKYMNADVVLDGGIDGQCTASTMFFLNTNYLHWRPHKDRNFVPLSPSRRFAINQDAEVQVLAWAGNLTCSGGKFHGRLTVT